MDSIGKLSCLQKLLYPTVGYLQLVCSWVVWEVVHFFCTCKLDGCLPAEESVDHIFDWQGLC